MPQTRGLGATVRRMPSEVPETQQRKLAPSERRLLRAKARGLGRMSSGNWWKVVGVSGLVFGVLCALTLMLSTAPWTLVTGFWFVVGLAITLWVRHDFNAQGRTYDAMQKGIESALRADRARVVDVHARAFVEFEEFEDEGACYAFEIDEGRLFFLSGQQYYESARFPCLDFSLVHVLDEGGQVVDVLIEKHGARALPERTVPAEVKVRMEIPDDQEIIEGELDELDALLGGTVL